MVVQTFPMKFPFFPRCGKTGGIISYYEGIKGKVSFSGKYVTPYTKDKTKGDMVVEVISTYTLPKK
jgi:hypothetical protein